MDVALMSKPTEIKAELPDDFSRKNEDATCWLLAMKAYFGMNDEIYKEEKNIMLVFLNKMSKGRGGTFAEGWYLKLINTAIPNSKKNIKILCDAFEECYSIGEPPTFFLKSTSCLCPSMVSHKIIVTWSTIKSSRVLLWLHRWYSWRDWHPSRQSGQGMKQGAS